MKKLLVKGSSLFFLFLILILVLSSIFYPGFKNNQEIKSESQLQIKDSVITESDETTVNSQELNIVPTSEPENKPVEVVATKKITNTQKPVVKTTPIPTQTPKVEAESTQSENAEPESQKPVVKEKTSYYIAPLDFKVRGVFNWNGYKWTYYSERVLPGGGLKIPGRWSDTYFVKDKDGNICLASSDLPWGTYVTTPWGPGRVYDCGCASGIIDVYVTW